VAYSAIILCRTFKDDDRIMNDKKFIALCILDGWGIAEAGKYNAIKNADAQYYNYLLDNYPNSKLYTSGEHVGLPKGQMGNSEVGHMTIGAGRVILQDLLRINRAIKSGELFQNQHIQELIKRTNTKSCHIIGLASDGGVHSHIDHMMEITQFLDEQNINVKLHLITDGRDTPPKYGLSTLAELQLKLLSSTRNASIATLSGRYYAMDRDKRYERTKKAYDVINNGSKKKFNSVCEAVESSYKIGITDEFIEPVSSRDYNGIEDGDSVIFINFRADRMRQLASALLLPEFGVFRVNKKKYAAQITMMPYSKELSQHSESIFKKENIKNHLSEILSRNNFSQLKAAETEKYAHVTFFFNAGREDLYPLEKRILIESPKVSTYDLKPEMSAAELTESIIAEISSNQYNFLLVNYANPDMVGHTGNYEATLKAIKIVDDCLRKLAQVVFAMNGTLIISADHGNAEEMFDRGIKCPHTSHTYNPVPFIIANKEYYQKDMKLTDGTLADIAPTILALYGIEKPPEMTGDNLMIHNKNLVKAHE